MKNKKLMKKLTGVLALLSGALAMAAQSVFGGRSLTVAANTYDAAVETHECSVRRTNDAAVTARHLLWKEGAAAGGAAVNTADDLPLGTIDNIESGTGVGMTVLVLGKGATKKMVAAGEIALGARVFTADGGKVQAEPAVAGTYYEVGASLTAAAADGDIIEVRDCAPVRVQVVANAADLTALKAAMTSPSLLKFLQS